MKRILSGAIILLVLLACLAIFFYYQGLGPVGGSGEKVFVVNRGESSWSIARRLEKLGLVKNQYVFLAYLKLTNQVGQLQSGSFKLSPASSLSGIVEELRIGRVDIWLTFVEGQRREEYAQLLSEEFDLPVEEFLSLTRGKEGRLFPDSYLLPTKVSVSQVVEKLVDNFEKKWQSINNQTALSQNQVLILASLVEREVKIEEDRPMVAGILIKRLESGWLLQVDATVQYAKGNQDNWWPKVTRQDLKTINSAYNTYINKGLPPTPICNPSLNAIDSVINYQETDYWYYLSDDSGQMHYAKTIKEHNQNIQNYLN